VGEPVGGAYHEAFKGKLGVKVHGGFPLSFGPVSVQLLVPEHQKLGIGIENFPQGIVDIFGAAAADGLPAEVGRGVQNQVFLVQLHHFRIVKPGRHRDRIQTLLHILQNFGPHIGR